MSQHSFYLAETYDLATATSTFSAANGAQAYTAGVTFYARLDVPSDTINGYLSCLFAPGTGTAGTAYIGLYSVAGTAAAGTLTNIGKSANIGGASAGIIRKAMATAISQVSDPSGVLYAALLVATDAGTDNIDFGRATPAVTLVSYDATYTADQTGGGGYPRFFKGAGTSLSVLPATEALSGVTGTDLLPWFAID